MKQLLMTEPGSLDWNEVADPEVSSAGQALVRPVAVATCDLDFPIITGQAPIPGPIAIGHEGIAEVLEIGSDVTSVATGDLVVVPFQISCGTCDNCRAGLTGNCQSVPERSMFGFGAFGGDWGGMLSDLLLVPYADAMLIKLPSGIDPASAASASDNIPDAWRTVAPYLRKSPDSEVLILGGGARSIGLYSVGIALAMGAKKVTYMDNDPGRLAVASNFGAQVVEGEFPRHADGRYPIVLDAGATRESLACACRSTTPGGDCTHVGIIYEPETPVPLLEMYSSGLTLHIGRVMAREVMPEVLDLIGQGDFNPAAVTDRVLDFDSAETALLEPHTKLVFSRA